MREHASSKFSSEVAYEILKYPSSPNADPCTTATPACSSNEVVNS